MKFLLDACASSRSLRALLSGRQQDVRLAGDANPQSSDENLLDMALREGRIIITEDKDFGELVFVRRLPHPCIVRFVEMRVEDQVAAMKELLDRHTTDMQAGAMITVTKGRIRIRRP